MLPEVGVTPLHDLGNRVDVHVLAPRVELGRRGGYLLLRCHRFRNERILRVGRYLDGGYLLAQGTLVQDAGIVGAADARRERIAGQLPAQSMTLNAAASMSGWRSSKLRCRFSTASEASTARS